MSTVWDSCAALVRRSDPDRYFSALFAPAALRPHLFALYAFNHELAHVGESVREPMIGEIRLAWWRETLEGARAGQPRPHDVARALSGTFAQVSLPPDLFEAMVAARGFDLMRGAFSDPTKYLDDTSANLMRLAARILGAGERHDDLAREAGLAYGLAGLVRNGRLAFTAEIVAGARRHLALARRVKIPKTVLPAFLPATLVPLFLRDPRREVSIHRRQIALLGASLRGRL